MTPGRELLHQRVDMLPESELITAARILKALQHPPDRFEVVEAKRERRKAAQKENFRLFHQLWSRAVGTENYNKEEWQRLSEVLWDAGVVRQG